MAGKPKVAVFGPNPMLSITIEALTAEGGDDIHVHAAGQGVSSLNQLYRGKSPVQFRK